MKNFHLVIGIVIILVLVCSPALAISKSDLISQYKGESAPTKLTPIPTPTPTPTFETIFFDPNTRSGYYPKIAKYVYNQPDEAADQYQQGLLHDSLFPVPSWVVNHTDYNGRVKSLIISSYKAS